METVVDEVLIGSLRLEVERPREPEALLDEEAFADDEFLPYWAESWPSGIALAHRLAATELEGRTVLELGCGLGLPALVAAMRGGAVVASDWSVDALELLGRNAARNGVALEMLRLDWRLPWPLHGRRFELVLAADVAYEERNVAPLLALLPAVTSAGGDVLVADPGRRYADGLLAGAAAGGWAVETDTDARLPRGGIHRLRRA